MIYYHKKIWNMMLLILSICSICCFSGCKFKSNYEIAVDAATEYMDRELIRQSVRGNGDLSPCAIFRVKSGDEIEDGKYEIVLWTTLHYRGGADLYEEYKLIVKVEGKTAQVKSAKNIVSRST